MRKIILSPGHGEDTAGKRSPDGQLMEWYFNRQIVNRIADKLRKAGIDFVILDNGKVDVPLRNRVMRANDYGKNALYISVHGNAAGDGSRWMNARGWSIYTSKGYTKADPIAQVFVEEADKVLQGTGMKVRKFSQKKYEQDYEENFYVLKNTIMPAVLTENFFYDNKQDMEFMNSPQGQELIANIHFLAIKRILEEGL